MESTYNKNKTKNTDLLKIPEEIETIAVPSGYLDYIILNDPGNKKRRLIILKEIQLECCNTKIDIVPTGGFYYEGKTRHIGNLTIVEGEAGERELELIGWVVFEREQNNKNKWEDNRWKVSEKEPKAFLFSFDMSSGTPIEYMKVIETSGIYNYVVNNSLSDNSVQIIFIGSTENQSEFMISINGIRHKVIFPWDKLKVSKFNYKDLIIYNENII